MNLNDKNLKELSYKEMKETNGCAIFLILIATGIITMSIILRRRR